MQSTVVRRYRYVCTVWKNDCNKWLQYDSLFSSIAWQGVLDFPDNRIQVQQPSIWVFDLKTDSLVRRYEIPSSVVSASHGLVSITIDVNDKQCQDAYAYLPDIKNYRLYVYRLVYIDFYSVSLLFFATRSKYFINKMINKVNIHISVID